LHRLTQIVKSESYKTPDHIENVENDSKTASH